MPQNIALAAFVLGAVLLLLAVSAGSFRIFGAEMSGASGRLSRIVAGVAGAGLIAFALVQYSGAFGPATKAAIPAPAPAAVAPAPAPPAQTGVTTPAAIEQPQEPPGSHHVVMGPLEVGKNRQGNDFDAFGQLTENAQLCAEMCRTEPDCKAMTYVIPTKRCWMKTIASPISDDANMISALKTLNAN